MSLCLLGCGPSLDGLDGLWEWVWTYDGAPWSQNVVIDANDDEVKVKSCKDALFISDESKTHRWLRFGDQLVNPGFDEIADGESEAVIVNGDQIQTPGQCDDCWIACQVDADVRECPRGSVEKSEEKCERISR